MGKKRKITQAYNVGDAIAQGEGNTAKVLLAFGTEIARLIMLRIQRRWIRRTVHQEIDPDYSTT